MRQDSSKDSLRPFFEPESLAVIGASRNEGKGGFNIVENLLRLGYPGRIFPINPRAEEILGLEAYQDIISTPEPPELALIVLPPDAVLKTVKNCIDRGVKAVIIESAGFGEMDESGARIEGQITRLAQEGGIRVMGPNSVGTVNPYMHLDTSLGRLNKLFLPEDDIVPGSVGFIGQTGLFTGVYLPLINAELGISKVACLGNKCDVDESDVLEYLADDPSTEIFAMYLESIRDGQRFLRLCRGIVREKPVIVLKSAVTEGGARASATHTGSIAGQDRVYEAAFRQAGIIRVGSFERLWDVTRAFLRAPLPRGNRVGIVNLAGSGCVTAVDACYRNGLEIARLSPAAKTKIKKLYPDWWQVRSPVDVWTAIEASGFEDTYTAITRAVIEDEGVDAVVVIMAAIDWLPGRDISELFSGIRKGFPDKPVIVVNPLGDGEVYLKMSRSFQSLGIPCYTSDEDAIFSLAALYRYRRYITEND